MSDTPNQPLSEIGVEGVRTGQGLAYEEFLPELQGEAGRRVYREMADNSPVIGAMRRAVEMLARRIGWSVTPADTGAAAAEGAAFLETVRDDMSHSWGAFVAEVIDSTPVYGWSYFETVYKRRLGPDQRDPARRSQHTDGRFGLRKLSLRPQSTLKDWIWDRQGGIQGMVQKGMFGVGTRPIPIEKALHFVVGNRRHPEGKSALRTAYKPYYKEKHVDHFESVGLERDLAGMPVGRIPGKYFNADASAADKAVKEAYVKMVRDVRFNDQGGVLIPSDLWANRDGELTDVPLVDLKLLSSNSTRAVDVDKVIRRLQHNQAMTWLADFVLLGMSNTGTWALSQSKVHLFVLSLEGWLAQVAEVVNRHLVPRLWRLNGLPHATMPRLVPGRPLPADLEELGRYVEALSRAGIPLFDDETAAHLRQVADLPEAPADEEAM